MSKYDPLGDHLRRQAKDEVPMTFAEIEKVTGATLPRSAYAYRPWWSNNSINSALTKVWINAGFRTERVDMAGRKLVFKRAAPDARRFAEDAMTYGLTPAAPGTVLPTSTHPMIGALKGLLKFAPGVDLIEPADSGWGEVAWGGGSLP